MKKYLKTSFITRMGMLLVTFMSVNAASAMTYEQAREQALFLTDKMAYELNLNAEQYDAAYEINLDYLMSVATVDDVYSVYWRQRNLDLEYILLDWQYAAYCATNYFYRPLYWDAGYWHFGIYAYYPHRDVFYFGRPTVYVSYRGGHGWRMNGGRSWYAGRITHYRGAGGAHRGMRDNYNNHRGNGSYRGGHNGRETARYQNNRSTMGTRGSSSMHNGSNINRNNMSGSRNGGYQSSTRTTVGNNSNMSSRSGSSMGSRSTGSNMGSRYNGSSSMGSRSSSSSMGSRSSNIGSRSSSSFGGSTRSSSGSMSGGTRSSGGSAGMSGGSRGGGMGRH